MNVDVVSAPTALKVEITPVELFNEAPDGKLPPTTSKRTVPADSGSVAYIVKVVVDILEFNIVPKLPAAVRNTGL